MFYNHLRHLTALLIIGFASLGLNAAYRHYDVSSGLPGNCIRSIVQDSVGYIWMATQNGLSRYNGITFTRFGKTSGPDGLSSLNIMKLCPHADNRHLWVATVEQLYLFDTATEQFNRFTMTAGNDGAEVGHVFSMTYDTDGCLWIGTRNGLFAYDSTAGSLVHYTHSPADANSMADDHVWVVFRDSSGTLWIGTRNGLSRYNPVTDSFANYRSSGLSFGKPACNDIISICESAQGSIYVGTWYGGIGRLNRDSGSFTYMFGEGDTLTIPRVRTIFRRSDESMFLGSDDGLYIFYPESGRCEHADTRHRHESVYECFRDREGGIWLGTYFSGASYLPPTSSNFQWYHPGNGRGTSLHGKIISQFCEDPSGKIWIATEDRGLNLFDPAADKFTALPHIGYHNLHALLWSDGKLLIGSFSKGLFVYEPSSGKVRNFTNVPDDSTSLINDHVYSIYRDRRGTIYVGTMDGCCTFDTATGLFAPVEQLRSNHIYDMTEDREGNLWIASKRQGVWRRDARTARWTNYRHSDRDSSTICCDDVLRVYADAAGTLWFGTEGKGLSRYNPGSDSFDNFTLERLIADNTIYGILADRSGHYWLSTNSGLVRFNPDTDEAQLYTFHDGLQSNQFNFRSSMQASDGYFYFGGVNGFNKFNPYNLAINTVKPSVVVSAVILHTPDNAINRSQRLNARNSAITIPHDIPLFDIQYESLSYVAPAKNQYAYRMDGIMKDWVYTDKNAVSFLNLSPGHYTFRVKSSNNDGVWSDNESTLSIDVLPSVWGSTWMKAIYTVMILCLLAALWLLFKRRQRIRHEQRARDEQQLRHQEVYQAKFNFFTQIAHEIKTPLTLIQAPLESVIEAHSWNTDVENNLHVIQKNTNRLLELVKQLLDFRKIDSGGYAVMFTATDMNRLIEDAAERFRTISMNGISLNVNVPEVHVRCMVDREAMIKIISNLLVNAMKYAIANIEISLTVDVKPGGDRPVMTISVRDDGPGIDAAEAEKVFEPFYQGQNHTGTSSGVGIGLSLVRLLVDKHSGSVCVNTDYTGGCEIRVIIPYLAPTEQDANSDEGAEIAINHTAPDQQQPAYSILVVEDNRDMRNFIANSLASAYTVRMTGNGNEALNILNEEAIDLIISDIIMPEMDGFDLLKAVRADDMLCHIPFILLSAIGSIDSKIEGLDYGADAYIEKPFSVNHIRATINNLRENRNRILKQFSSMPSLGCAIPATGSADTSWMNKLHEIITSNLADETFTIDVLSQEMNLSRSSLQRKLKGIADMTPNDYIRLIRLKAAGELLRKGEYRINEVCYLVGFNNPSYFSRCFYRQFGILPKDYARQCADGTEKTSGATDAPDVLTK